MSLLRLPHWKIGVLNSLGFYPYTVYKSILTTSVFGLFTYYGNMGPEICVLAFHPNNEDVVYFLVADGLVAYNIRTEKAEICSAPFLLRRMRRYN